MEYTLTTAVQEHLAKTGESPESFLNRAVDALIRKEMAQGFNDLPREAVIDAVPLGLGSLLLLTFADGDRRLFDGEILKENENFKNIRSEIDFNCVSIEGCTVAWKDNHGLHDGLFDELPPGFLYENSVSLIELKHAASVKLGLKKVGKAAEPPLDEDDLRKKVFLPDDFVRANDPDIAQSKAPVTKNRRTKKKTAPPVVTEEFVPLEKM